MQNDFASRSRRWAITLADDVIRFLLDDAAVFVTILALFAFTAFTVTHLPLHVHHDMPAWRLFTVAAVVLIVGALLCSWPWSRDIGNRELFIIVANATVGDLTNACYSYVRGGWSDLAFNLAMMTVAAIGVFAILSRQRIRS